MGLTELTLRDFRPFREIVLHPDPHAITLLISENGTGKTSVLEAVYALATASSFRTSTAADMIRRGTTTAEVHGVVVQNERRVQIDLTLTRGARQTTKRMLVNGQRPGSRSELSQVIPLTTFTPEGVDVVRGAPEERRTYLTTLLSDVDLTTGELIERFHRVLRQRNAAIRALNGYAPSTSQRGEIEVWSSELAEVGTALAVQRERLVARLAPLVGGYYRELAGDFTDVQLSYERSWSGELVDALATAFDDDRARGYTTVGPHRDDVRISLDGRDTRRQASQGEQRSLAFALRLAGHDLVRSDRGVEPLLLLDDVFSELDPLRSHRLLGLLPVGQTLVTTASPVPDQLVPAAVVDLTRETR